MKATGIIRRIDELGRIVIPKEMRKTLRIREGEKLEIFVDNNENIVLRKYSIIKKLDDFAQNFTDAIHTFIKNNILIADNDNFLAVSGSLKKDYLNKPISMEIESKIKRREEMIEKHKKTIKLIEDRELNATYAVSPIIVSGDTVGLIMVISEDELTDSDFKIIQIASKFLSTHLEQ